jgi:CheY-like chemotaxis protein
MRLLYAHHARRILVVDDEPLVRTLCATLLQDWGYDVTEAQDGVDALAKLAEFAFDAVLLDLNMPRLRGDAVLAQLRHERPDLPVIMMSSDGHEVRSRVLHLGARSFLTKPFSPPQLRDHVASVLRCGQVGTVATPH